MNKKIDWKKPIRFAGTSGDSQCEPKHVYTDKRPDIEYPHRIEWGANFHTMVDCCGCNGQGCNVENYEPVAYFSINSKKCSWFFGSNRRLAITYRDECRNDGIDCDVYRATLLEDE